MARLSANGDEIGRVELLKSRLSVRSNGKVLRDQGWGWKLYKTLKPGVDPARFVVNYKLDIEDFRAKRPMWAKFADLAMQEALKLRTLLLMSIEESPDDPDGIWSRLDDNYETRGKMTHSEISELCLLYRCVLAEAAELKAAPEEKED